MCDFKIFQFIHHPSSIVRFVEQNMTFLKVHCAHGRTGLIGPIRQYVICTICQNKNSTTLIKINGLMIAEEN